MAFSYVASGDYQNTSSTTSTQNPTSGVEGDMVILWAVSRSASSTMDFTDPTGFTPIGSVTRAQNTSLGANQHLAARFWWGLRPAGASFPLSVTRDSGANTVMRIGFALLRSDAAETAGVFGTQDDTTGTTNSAAFTPADYATPNGTAMIFAFAGPDVSGALSTPSPLQSFTLDDTYSSDNPAGLALSKAVTAGTIDLPTFVRGSATAWVTRVITIDRVSGGIYVDGAVHLA